MADIRSIGGNPIVPEAAGGELLETIDNKADIDGYYAQLTAGAADNLTGRGAAVGAQYLHRTAGGTDSIESGQAVIEAIYGNTLRWNQLAYAYDSASWTVSGNAAISTEGAALKLTTSGSSGNQCRARNVRDYIPANHKVLIAATVDTSNTTKSTTFGLYGDSGGGTSVAGINVAAGTAKERYAEIKTNTSANTKVSFALAISSSTPTGEYTLFSDMLCIDLTAMFGAGNEPATVAEFESLFPAPYYPYSAGELLPVSMEGVRTVGFNQWDEQWELGQWNNSTGAKASAADRIRSKNKIPAFPSTEYCIRGGTGGAQVLFYDADGEYISYLGNLALANHPTFTTPANCHFITFNTYANYGTTYNHDICINLSWSGYRDGEYESYWSSEREIPAATYFPNGLRSAGTVRDELTEDAAITRVGEVDLGTLTWTRVETATDSGIYCFYSSTFDRTVSNVLDLTKAPYLKCDRYQEVAGTRTALTTDKTLAEYNGANTRIAIRDDAYTDAADFKTAMSGVMLHYALAEPTTVEIDPPLNLGYRVDDFGTEEVMVPTGEMSAPVPMSIAYGMNVVDTIRRLGVDYISHASFAQFTAALASALGLTITETYDETDERYEYSIATVEEGE